MAYTEPVLTRRIPTNPADRRKVWYEQYVATGGYNALRRALEMTPDDIIKVVTDSGLRGRGGAGFSAGQKWAFIPKEKKSVHYLAVNADESEPGTFKDRHLMEWDPHQLLEGIAIASLATRCDVAYIFIRGEFHHGAKVLERAVAEAYHHGVFGKSILGSGKSLECYVHRGAGAYICGEETGMLEAIEGKRGWPRNKPPFPAISGVFGKPTVINNVETLCCVPHILERGAQWFRSMGTPSSPGPKLYGMSGHVNRPGVYEEELGITLAKAIELAGGMKGGRHKGTICGGISMGVLGPDQLDIRLDFDDVRFRGGCLGLGTAGMIVMNEHTDMVRALRNCVRFYAHESCGQCTPCREGSAWMKKILDRIVDGQGRARDLEMLMELEKTMGSIPGTTICGLADGTAWATRTFINKYYEEFAARCPEEPHRRVSLPVSRGNRLVATPMGSNTR
ncbi:MAG: NADH-quinone oxidoreductase subunit NuoF [Phycisphaerae bacterium]|nr:NADH-quinone oxidoreductase subunit NuoF [Phycisphaerae bacterium]MDW8262470.1 NADH-quinone oxidoreductase subunit NuoF [Phycisphaerales bacterium]